MRVSRVLRFCGAMAVLGGVFAEGSQREVLGDLPEEQKGEDPEACMVEKLALKEMRRVTDNTGSSESKLVQTLLAEYAPHKVCDLVDEKNSANLNICPSLPVDQDGKTGQPCLGDEFYQGLNKYIKHSDCLAAMTLSGVPLDRLIGEGGTVRVYISQLEEAQQNEALNETKKQTYKEAEDLAQAWVDAAENVEKAMPQLKDLLQDARYALARTYCALTDPTQSAHILNVNNAVFFRINTQNRGYM